MSSILLSPTFQPMDGNGEGYPGAKLYVYAAGTTDKVKIFEDNDLAIEGVNPAIAFASGRFPTIYLGPDLYKYVLHDANDVPIDTWDDIANTVAGTGGLLPVASGGTGADNAATARSNLNAASQSDLTALSDDVAAMLGDYDVIGGSFGTLAAQNEVFVEDMAAGQRLVLDRKVNNGGGSMSSATTYKSLTITPKHTDSKFLIRATGYLNSAGSSTTPYLVGLFRGGSALNSCSVQPNSVSAFAIEASYEAIHAGPHTFTLQSNGPAAGVTLVVEEWINTPVIDA
jgi:hypothetical protein